MTKKNKQNRRDIVSVKFREILLKLVSPLGPLGYPYDSLLWLEITWYYNAQSFNAHRSLRFCIQKDTTRDGDLD